LDAVNAQLVTRTAELNNVQQHIGALHNLVAQFRQRLEHCEHREQDGQLLHNDLLQIVSFILFLTFFMNFECRSNVYQITRQLFSVSPCMHELIIIIFTIRLVIYDSLNIHKGQM
jgi:hypothetical protein